MFLIFWDPSDAFKSIELIITTCLSVGYNMIKINDLHFYIQSLRLYVYVPNFGKFFTTFKNECIVLGTCRFLAREI